MAKEFKVGDRVQLVLRTIVCPDGLKLCALGTVVHTSRNGTYGVDWDEEFNGHNCTGHARSGHGWYIRENQIEPLDGDIEIDYLPDLDLLF